jgi:hypothetical protein
MAATGNWLLTGACPASLGVRRFAGFTLAFVRFADAPDCLEDVFTVVFFFDLRAMTVPSLANAALRHITPCFPQALM